MGVVGGGARAGGGAEEVVLLVTNGDLGGALRTALTSYRLLRLASAHDGQQRLQEDVQQGLHHHLHLLLDTRVLQAEGGVMRRRKVISAAFI